MHIIEQATYYEVHFNYHKQILNAIKNFPRSNREYDPVKKFWKVAKVHKPQLDYLLEKYGEANEAKQKMILGVIPPLPYLNQKIDLLRPSYPFQDRGTAFLLKHKRVIVGDDMGLGKTQQTIAAWVAEGRPPIIVMCTSSAVYNWQAEFEMIAGEKAIVMQPSIKKTWHQYFKQGLCKVFICNYESLRSYFVEKIDVPRGEKFKARHVVLHPILERFYAVIADESHKLKDPNTQRTKIAAAIAVHPNRKFIYAISGTPVMNRVADLIPQLYITKNIHLFKNEKYFRERYCKQKTYLKELHYLLSTTCFYKRMKKEVAHEMPEKTRKVIYCDITNRDEYNEAVHNLENYLRDYSEAPDHKIASAMRAKALVQINLCKAISARGKLQDAYSEIDTLLEAGEKVVIFCHSKKVAEALHEKYPDFPVISGAQDAIEKRAANMKFQEDENCKGIICGIKAASESINLTAATYMLVLELPWNAATADQMEDRVHRIGLKNGFTAMWMIGRNTFDVDNYNLIEEKRKIANTITGNEDTTETEIFDLALKKLRIA